MKTGKNFIQTYIDSLSKSIGTDLGTELVVTIDRFLAEAEDRGYEMALQTIESKLPDGPENNLMRAAVAQRARELRADIKKFKTKKGKA